MGYVHEGFVCDGPGVLCTGVSRRVIPVIKDQGIMFEGFCLLGVYSTRAYAHHGFCL